MRPSRSSRTRADGTLTTAVRDIPAALETPLRLAVDDEPVDPSDVFLFHKTTRREPYDRRRDKHPNVDDVLLVNTRGEVTESTVANVAVKLDGEWVTPPRESGLLAGTYREILLREGHLSERAVTVEDLRRAEGIALVSSVRGWREVAVIA
jgi:para-aminobenzoate synthetase/4-amino-4-deoxychorismate lyase